MKREQTQYALMEKLTVMYETNIHVSMLGSRKQTLVQVLMEGRQVETGSRFSFCGQSLSDLKLKESTPVSQKYLSGLR